MQDNEKVARLTAQAMLARAGLPCRLSNDEVTLLATDILAVAAEVLTFANTGAHGVKMACLELERRIGGIGNLASYVATLRAQSKVSFLAD